MVQIVRRARRRVWSKYSNAERVSSLHLSKGCLNPVIRKKEDRVLTGRQPWELRFCELVFASVEVLHSVAAGPPTQ